MGEDGFVWSGDDSDPPEEGTQTEEASGRVGDADDESTPFEDLLDRIEADRRRPADPDELADALPAVDGSDDPADIDRLLERIDLERDRTDVPGPSARTGDGESSESEEASDPALDDPGDGAPERDSGQASADGRSGELPAPPDDPPDPAREGSERPAPDGADDEDGEPPAGGPEGPFGDLLDRVGREADRRGAGPRSGATDPADRGPFAVDAGSLPEDASGVLLLGTADAVDDFDATLSLVEETTDPRRTNLLLVWLSRDVTGRLERLYERYADRSTDVTVVCRSKVERTLRAESAIPADGLEGNLSIERISDPRDLPKLGIAISQAIGDSAGGPQETVMCFHSITDLLQFASHERVFRFLHVLQGRIDSIDATAYYHIDRDAHEERTVATFWNLFDATVDLADGSNVRGR